MPRCLRHLFFDWSQIITRRSSFAVFSQHLAVFLSTLPAVSPSKPLSKTKRHLSRRPSFIMQEKRR